MSKNLRGILFSLIVFLGVMTVWEAVLVLNGYQGNRYRSILFGDDPDSAFLFEESPGLWWKLRKNVTVSFLQKKVHTNKLGLRDSPQPENESATGSTVLCLGDSSTFGWKVDFQNTYPYFLEQILRQENARSRVLNAGVPGYTSYQSLKLFEGIASKVNPDVVIIYSSNNENSLAQFSDLERANHSGPWIPMREFLSRFLWYQFLKEQLVPPQPFKLTGSISLEQILKKVPRVSRGDYGKNLAEIITLARANGIAPVLVTVPNNPAHPYLFNLPDSHPKVNDWVTAAEYHIKKGDYSKARDLIQQAGDVAPDYYQIHYYRGRILEHEGDKNSMAEYEKALEAHPFPERLKSSYQETAIQTARSLNVPLVDLRRKFRESPLKTDELFIDAVHPSPDGHRLIAGELAQPVLRQLNGEGQDKMKSPDFQARRD